MGLLADATSCVSTNMKTGCTNTVVVARSAQARDAARSLLGLDSFEKLLAWIQPCLGSCKYK